MGGGIQRTDQDPDCQAEAGRGQSRVRRAIRAETAEGGRQIRGRAVPGAGAALRRDVWLLDQPCTYTHTPTALQSIFCTPVACGWPCLTVFVQIELCLGSATRHYSPTMLQVGLRLS